MNFKIVPKAVCDPEYCSKSKLQYDMYVVHCRKLTNEEGPIFLNSAFGTTFRIIIRYKEANRNFLFIFLFNKEVSKF